MLLMDHLLNRQGQIKHIYRHFVFIFSRTLTENGGLFVCKSKKFIISWWNNQKYLLYHY